MKLIKLTSAITGKPVYINIEHIGHFYQKDIEVSHGRVTCEAHTVVGVITHNNGGFKVAEDIKQILKLLEKH